MEAAVPGEGGERFAGAPRFTRKIVATSACLAALLALPYAHPRLGRLRLFDPKPAARVEEASALDPPPAAVGEVALPGAALDEQRIHAAEREALPADVRSPIAKVAPVAAPAAPAASTKADGKPPRSIEDASSKALDAFFAKLEKVERKEPGAVARILYYGDSIVASDLITSKLRRLLQSRYGDAGHGYALLANAWNGWFHIDVSRTASSHWKASRVLGPFAADGFYGLGGASFRAEEPNAWAKFGTVEGEWGSAVSRFEIEYLAQPGGGDLALSIDGKPAGVLSTAADAPRLARHEVKVADGPHSLEVRTVDKRPVRAFGIKMERDTPGVILSACGLTGGRARFLDKSDDAHWAEALRAATPDLVVLAFGTNESRDGLAYPLADYEKTLREVMRQVRAALPDASLMLAGPPDAATDTEGERRSKSVIPLLIDVQRKLAKEQGWAFWDQFLAMGGAGSMWSWMQAGMGSADMYHPSGAGGNWLGTAQYRAIVEGFDAYKARRGAAP